MDRELLLLGLLRQQEMHGYQLMELFDRALNFCVDIKKPTAYFLLDKMAEAGWITQTESQAGHRPPRRVYRLTPQGETEFQRLLRENLANYSPALFPSDTGLAFIDALEPEAALDLLHQRRASLAAALAKAQSVPPHAGSTQFIIEHQIRHLTAELEWLDEIMGRLAAPRQPLATPASKPAHTRARASKVAA
jgi:DNA-binding PadR family transcriptional regulator